MALGCLAGVLASVVAADVHDAHATVTELVVPQPPDLPREPGSPAGTLTATVATSTRPPAG